MKKRTVQNIITTIAALLALYVIIYKAQVVAYRGWDNLATVGGWIDVGAVIYFSIVFILFIIRKPSLDECNTVIHWVVALVSVWLPLFMQLLPQHSPLLSWIALPTQVVGLMITLVAISTLGRGFGIIAARRDIKIIGIYQLIRHPLYAGEILILVALAVENPSWFNTIIFIIVMICLWVRMNDEETILSKDERYADYLQRVRYRLIPGVV